MEPGQLLDYGFDILLGKVLLSAWRKREEPKTDLGTMAYFTPKLIKDYGAPFDGIPEAFFLCKFI